MKKTKKNIATNLLQLKTKADKSLKKDLMDKFELLERDKSVGNISESLDTFKRELQSLRESQLKSNYVRSQAQWLHSGEKPS